MLALIIVHALLLSWSLHSVDGSLVGQVSDLQPHLYRSMPYGEELLSLMEGQVESIGPIANIKLLSSFSGTCKCGRGTVSHCMQGYVLCMIKRGLLPFNSCFYMRLGCLWHSLHRKL